MPHKIDRIEMECTIPAHESRPIGEKGHDMGGNGSKSEPPKQDNDKSKKPKGKPVEDEDNEDGDIATPKRDRYGNDDEPL
jgi:hypothetical protein